MISQVCVSRILKGNLMSLLKPGNACQNSCLVGGRVQRDADNLNLKEENLHVEGII